MMTEKVTILLQESCIVPRILFPSPNDLASWYVDQLRQDLARGQRQLSISCFNAEAIGFSSHQAAFAVLKAVTDFLYDHPEAEHLQIFCGDQKTLSAYQFNWNMWYAEHKPEHDD